MIELYQGDCLHVIEHLNDESVDLVIADPPYFKIKKNSWDNQWETIFDYIDWLEQIIIKVKRVLKKNGSLYIFCDNKKAAYIQVMIDKHLTLLNNITWVKTNGRAKMNARHLRSYAPITERILFYTPQICKTGLQTIKHNINNFSPLRDYFKQLQNKIGYKLKKINEILGHRKSEHAFYWNSTQWNLPPFEVYNELIKVFKIDQWGGFREYESLRQEYESLRRIFNAGEGLLDVIQAPTVNQQDNTLHPTTKPYKLIERLVEVSSNKGQTVMDFCMGSGTTGVAAKQTGRKFIGIEKDREYFKISQKRINNIPNQLTF